MFLTKNLLKLLMTTIPIVLFCTMQISKAQWSQNKISKATWKGTEIEYIDGQVEIKFKEPPSEQNLSRIVNLLNGKIINRLDSLGWVVVSLPPDSGVINAISLIESDPLIEIVVPRVLGRPAEVIPNDTFFTVKQWYLKNTGQTDGKKEADIKASYAWTITTGDTNVVMVILDTGIPLNSDGTLAHPDLSNANRIIVGPDVIYPIIHSLNLPDWNETDARPNDEDGHGTHVAGLAGAEYNNGIGISGVAGGCKIMAIQIFGKRSNGEFLTLDTAFRVGVHYAVDYACNHPDKKVVINASTAFPAPSLDQSEAVSYASLHNVLIAAAVGNKQYEFDPDSIQWPAKYSLNYSNVIAVGATNDLDEKSFYSIRGLALNVCAPGGWRCIDHGERCVEYVPSFMWSTVAPNLYAYKVGTSMAAPLVTGTAALMLSINPNLTPNTIRSYLESTAEDLGNPGWDQSYGYGRINAFEALLTVLQSSLVVSPSDCATISNPPTLTWSTVPAAASYGIQIAANSNFSNPLYDTSGIDTNSFHPDGLSENATYYWHISFTINDTTRWSQTWKFHLSPPPTPQLLSFA